MDLTSAFKNVPPWGWAVAGVGSLGVVFLGEHHKKNAAAVDNPASSENAVDGADAPAATVVDGLGGVSQPGDPASAAYDWSATDAAGNTYDYSGNATGAPVSFVTPAPSSGGYGSVLPNPVGPAPAAPAPQSPDNALIALLAAEMAAERKGGAAGSSAGSTSWPKNATNPAPGKPGHVPGHGPHYVPGTKTHGLTGGGLPNRHKGQHFVPGHFAGHSGGYDPHGVPHDAKHHFVAGRWVRN